MTTNTAVTRYIEAPLGERHEYAQALASAGDLIPRSLFGPPIDGKPPQPSVGKVLLVIETGAMLGIHPIAALSSINVIEGKPAASAALISGVLRGAGHKLRISESGTIEGGDYKATATLVRSDDPDNPFTSTWTPQRAARAGLCTYSADDAGIWKVTARSQQGKALPWESYTESLCKSRIVSEVGRDGGQDVLLGIRYTPEELGGSIDSNGEYTGEMIEAETVPEATGPSATPPARKRATNGTQGTKRSKAPAATPEAADEPTAPQEPEADPNVVDAEVVEDEPMPTDDGPAEALGDDGSNPDAIDRADEAAVRQYNETHGKATGHFITSDAEREANAARLSADEDAERKAATAALVEQAKIDGAATRAKREAEEAEAADRVERERIANEQEAALREQEAIEHADPQTGEVPEVDEGEATAKRIAADRAARGARTTATKEEAAATVKGEPEPWAEISAYDVVTAATPEEWEQRLDAATNVAQVKQVWDEASLVEGAMTTALRMSIVKHKARVIEAAEQQG